jgi:hypothetical protein
MANKLKTHISFIDLFGDAFARDKFTNTLRLRPAECVFREQTLVTREDLDEWLKSELLEDREHISSTPVLWHLQLGARY